MTALSSEKPNAELAAPVRTTLPVPPMVRPPLFEFDVIPPPRVRVPAEFTVRRLEPSAMVPLTALVPSPEMVLAEPSVTLFASVTVSPTCSVPPPRLTPPVPNALLLVEAVRVPPLIVVVPE